MVISLKSPLIFFSLSFSLSAKHTQHSFFNGHEKPGCLCSHQRLPSNQPRPSRVCWQIKDLHKFVYCLFHSAVQWFAPLCFFEERTVACEHSADCTPRLCNWQRARAIRGSLQTVLARLVLCHVAVPLVASFKSDGPLFSCWLVMGLSEWQLMGWKVVCREQESPGTNL